MQRTVLVCLVMLVQAGPFLSAQEAPNPRLLVAFASYRQRPKHPNIYFYEHDGVAGGKAVGMVGGTPQPTADAYARPSLTPDGRLCAFTHEVENKTSRVYLWDLKGQKLSDLAAVNTSPNAQMHPSLSADGKLLAFAAWNRPGAGQGWHVLLYDLQANRLLELPNLNGAAGAARGPVLSGDGRFLAFAANTKTGAGLTDVILYDRQAKQVLPLPGVNSRHMDAEPSLSRDGRLLAFVSDRPGGMGGRDIYLFDRSAGKYLPLPALNSAAHEYSPALSPDGRFLAFVSERLGGEGERDIHLYDRRAQKLLPAPGLNSKTDDFDPSVIVVP